MDLQTQRIFISRDVIFYEDIFLYRSTSTDDFVDFSTLAVPNVVSSLPPDSNEVLVSSFPVTHQALLVDEVDIAQPVVVSTENPDFVAPAANILAQTSVSTDHVLRRSTRSTRLPTHLQDYEVTIPQQPLQYSSAIIRTSPHSLSQMFSYHKLSCSHKAYAVAIHNLTEPKSYSEAIQHQCW